MIKSLLAKILFVVGIIIVLVLLAWAIIHFVPTIFSTLANVSSSLGNIFRNKNEAIELVVDDNNLVNGESFNVSWDLDTEEIGNYSLTYECVDGLMFDIAVGSSTKRMICNTPFTLEEGVTEASIKTTYTKVNSFEDLNLLVYFTPNNQTTPEYGGKTLITVKNESPEGSENTNSSNSSEGDLTASSLTSDPVETTEGPIQNTNNTPSYSPTQSYYRPTTIVSSPADLAISNVISIPNRSTVQFTVSNIGGRSSGNWQLSYTTPTSPKTTEYSPIQPSLAPGQSLRFTLSFTEQSSRVEAIVITVDPANLITESSKSNNSSVVSVSAPTFPTNNGGNTGGGNYNPNDDADLIITKVEIGRDSGGRFVRDDSVNEGDDVVLHFVVVNKGGKNTGTWRFEVTETPFDNEDDYRSGRINSLRPGEIMDLYVEFRNVDEGNYDIEIEVDSDDDVDEESERNNTGSIELRVRR